MRRTLVAALVGSLVVAGAGVAVASSTTAPDRVVEHGEVPLAGVIDEPPLERTGVAELRLTGPGVVELPVARAAQPSPEDPRRDPAQVAFPLLTAPCTLSNELCTGGTVLPNGTWTLRLFEVDRARDAPEVERGAATQFVVDVPAFAPQDVAATLEGRTVTVAWDRAVGPDQSLVEPDVRYRVDDGQGRFVVVGPEVCPDGRCRAAVAYPDDVSGPRSFTVAAARPGGQPPAVTPVAGEVVVPAVPGVPSASPSAVAPGGGSGEATAQSFAQGFSDLAPGVSLPGLPTPASPGTTPPSVAGPLVADTFEPTLGFQDRTARERAPDVAAPGGRGGVLTSTDTGLLGNEQVARNLAGALLMLMGGAHLRTWLAGNRPVEH